MDALPDCVPDPGGGRLVQETRSGGLLNRRRSLFGARLGSFGLVWDSFKARSGLAREEARPARARPGWDSEGSFGHKC